MKNANELLSEPKFKFAYKMMYLSDGDMNGIAEQINLLCIDESYKEKVQEVLSISN